MSNSICQLFRETPPGTGVKELIVNGEGVQAVDKFVRYDDWTGLVFFTNKSNSTFVAVCDQIEMIEFSNGEI